MGPYPFMARTASWATTRMHLRMGRASSQDAAGSIGLVYYSQGPYWPLNTTLYVRDFHGNNERYIYHFLSHLGLERFAASTGVPSLNRNFVHPHLVVIPPLEEQRAIAAVLDAIDDAIERTEAVIAATERLRDALLHELLTRGVPGCHTARKEAPGASGPSRRRGRWCDWRRWRLIPGEQSQGHSGPSIGSRFYVSEGVPVIRGNNLPIQATGERFVDSGFVFLTDEKADEFVRLGVPPQ